MQPNPTISDSYSPYYATTQPSSTTAKPARSKEDHRPTTCLNNRYLQVRSCSTLTQGTNISK